jgi:hypothetical protein
MKRCPSSGTITLGEDRYVLVRAKGTIVFLTSI